MKIYVIRKTEIKRVVKKTWGEECQSAGIKNELTSWHYYVELSKTRIVDIANNSFKYHKFNGKFTNKAVPQPVKAKRVMSQVQLNPVSVKSQAVS